MKGSDWGLLHPEDILSTHNWLIMSILKQNMSILQYFSQIYLRKHREAIYLQHAMCFLSQAILSVSQVVDGHNPVQEIDFQSMSQVNTELQISSNRIH
jgi:hypothetical protein